MDELVEQGVAWACAHGLEMVAGEDPAMVTHAPMALVPTQLSKTAFEHALQMTLPFNELVDKVARDTAWVFKTLDGVLAHDDFTARLVQLCKEVEAEGVVQRTYLGVHRSDYMLDHGRTLLQVELNTIASSFGCLSARVSRMHRFLLSRHVDNAIVQGWVAAAPGAAAIDSSLPTNAADTAIPSALARAAKHYLAATKSTSAPLVLFVVQEGERNSFDQRWLEYELWDKHGVATVRRSLSQLAKEAQLVGDGRSLHVGGREVCVVYFRAGYTPNDYPSETQWEARKLVERSGAIKCPSIQYHLVGTKKVQQELARPGQLERFVGQDAASSLRTCFAGLWSLDAAEQDDAARAAVDDAISNPENYVVKPQREGGGNNIYGNAVRETLQSMPKAEQASYILMQRIFPEEVDAVLVRRGQAVQVKALQELGVYGVFLGGESGDPVFSENAGHLLRTKQVGVDEGGVATGFSCLDSPLLV